MNEEDWAIVIGITEYPALQPLRGPETDARAFFSWVTTAGGVPFNPVSDGFEFGSNQAMAVLTSEIKRQLLREENIPAPEYAVRVNTF